MDLRDLTPAEAEAVEKEFARLVKLAWPKEPVKGEIREVDAPGIQSWLTEE